MLDSKRVLHGTISGENPPKIRYPCKLATPLEELLQSAGSLCLASPLPLFPVLSHRTAAPMALQAIEATMEVRHEIEMTSAGRRGVTSHHANKPQPERDHLSAFYDAEYKQWGPRTWIKRCHDKCEVWRIRLQIVNAGGVDVV